MISNLFTFDVLMAVSVLAILTACPTYFIYSLARTKPSARPIPYFPHGVHGWLLVFVLCSMVVSNAGLTLILKLSIPVLMAIYPVALMLIILGLTHQFNRHYSKVYPLTITFTAVVSIAGAIQDIGVSIPLLSYLPFYSIGLEWVSPALIGWVIGVFYSHRRADS